MAPNPLAVRLSSFPYRAHRLPTDAEQSWKAAEEMLAGLAERDERELEERHLDERERRELQGRRETLAEQRKAVRARWIDEGRRYDALWRNSRFAHYGTRIPIIGGSVTVPVLVSLSLPRIATALVGLVVAVLTGLDSFFQYSDRWKQQRRAATAIKSEGWEFVELSAVYKNYREGKPRADAYTFFLTRLEELIEKLERTYIDLFHDGQSPRAPAGGGT